MTIIELLAKELLDTGRAAVEYGNTRSASTARNYLNQAAVSVGLRVSTHKSDQVVTGMVRIHDKRKSRLWCTDCGGPIVAYSEGDQSFFERTMRCHQHARLFTLSERIAREARHRH